MPFLRKRSQGSDSFGHVWRHDGSVVWVDDHEAEQLYRLPGHDFEEVPPGEVLILDEPPQPAHTTETTPGSIAADTDEDADRVVDPATPEQVETIPAVPGQHQVPTPGTTVEHHTGGDGGLIEDPAVPGRDVTTVETGLAADLRDAVDGDEGDGEKADRDGDGVADGDEKKARHVDEATGAAKPAGGPGRPVDTAETSTADAKAKTPAARRSSTRRA